MQSNSNVLSFFLSILLCASNGFAQGTKADYERMSQLAQRTSNKVFRVDVNPNWLDDGERFWYRVQTAPDAYEFIFVDLQKGSRTSAFDQARVAKQLSNQSGKEVSADRLPLTDLRFSKDGGRAYGKFNGKTWLVERAESKVTEAKEGEAPKASPTLKALRPSIDKGGDLHLTFVNKSSGPLRTIWIDRNGRRVPYRSFGPGETSRQHTFEGHIWLVLNQRDEAVALLEARAGETRVEIDGKNKINLPAARRRRRGGRSRSNATSPDGRHRALVRDNVVYLVGAESKEERKLAEVNESGQEFEGEFFWSPNSQYLVCLQSTPGQQREIHLIESAPRDQLQPKLHTLNYAKPGDPIQQQWPRMFKVADFKEVDLPRSLFENPWRNDRFQWRADSSEFVFRFNQRGHQTMRIIGVRPSDGAVRTIIDESTRTFIDYTNKVFTHFDETHDEIVWMSERDGWNHLYLYDWQEGKLKNQITRGGWIVRQVDRVDAEQRKIWFRASGIVKGQDPYYIHFCRIDFDGSNLTLLSEGDGTHSIRYSPDRKYLIDQYSRVDLPPVTTVRRAEDGSLVCSLEKGDWTRLEKTGWRAAVPFSAKGRDGKTDIHGVIYLPTNFSKDKTYPVIEYIYAGPHGSFTPKSFSVRNQAREMAELGFVVVQLDGMGTSNRSKAFHDVCWRNLGDSGFPDRILWLKAAAKEIPQMDVSRVGVYGGSAGGQSALRALLAHGDFYKAAVADCGCHDNRMDKIWWNEQWMGWPIASHYQEQSNVTNAHKLQGDLLLIVGELDRNVDPASTMQVVDALIKADKDFDLIVVPGAGHGVGSRRYGMRRTRDFFVRKLHGVEPRRE